MVIKVKKIFLTAYNLDFGGIEKALLSLLSNIDYQKYDVTLFLEKKEGIFLDKVPTNVKIKEYKISTCKITIIRKLINRIKLLLTILLIYHKYDFSCCYATYSIPGSILARYASKNNSLWVHNNYYYFYKENINDIKNFFSSINIGNFKHIIFVAKEAKDDFIRIYPQLKDKSVACNNLINYEEIITLSKEDVIENKSDKKLFVNVGRHDEHQKQLTRLIEASKKLVDDGYNFEVWLIGIGPDTEKYKDLIHTYHLENTVKLMGSRVNPYPYYKLADAFIMTSNYEGFPVVYLESLIFNLPIITTIDLSLDNKAIQENYGIVVEKNIDSIYKGMKEFVDNNFVIEEPFDAKEYNQFILEKIEKFINDDWLVK